MPYGTSATVPVKVGLTSNGVRSVAISSGSTPPFVVNWDATTLTGSSASLCVDPIAILTGASGADDDDAVVIFATGNGEGHNSGSQLLLRCSVGNDSAPTLTGALQVGAFGRFPGRGPGQTDLLLPHEVLTADFPAVDPEEGVWDVLFDIDGESLISIPSPNFSAPTMADTSRALDTWAGKWVRVPLYGADLCMVTIRGALALSAGSAVVMGRIVN